MKSKPVSIVMKKIPSIVVMIITMTPVMIVSRRDGHTIFDVSWRTWRMNSIGLVRATWAILRAKLVTGRGAWVRCPVLPEEPALPYHAVGLGTVSSFEGRETQVADQR